MRPRRPLLGLRREVLILLPASVLLLVVLSTFTLFAYRSAINLLVEDRRNEAAQSAQLIAEHVAYALESPDADSLRQLAPDASGVAILEPGGRALIATGDLADADLLLAPIPRPLPRPVGRGPGDLYPDIVAGFAPVKTRVGERVIRVNLPAALLASQQASLGPLSLFVIVINTALAVLVLLFLPRLLAPYDSMLARARRLGASAAQDEVEFLLETFDRAVDSLSNRDRKVEDDITALERTLSGSLKSGLLLLDREANVLALNAVGAALLGADGIEAGTPAAVRPLAALLARQPQLLDLLTAAIRESRSLQREECSLSSPDGDLIVGLTVHPLRRDDGGIRGYLVLFTNLTEARRRADSARLAESLASLGELAGGVAHELRNGLATLRGYLTLIERHPGEESVSDFVGEIRRESDHLQRVVEDFLSFARPGSARIEEFRLDSLVRQAVSDPVLSGVAVRIREPLPDLSVKGDPGLLLRAIRNLLHNGVEAQREGGSSEAVEVGVERTAGGVELLIDDRGPGIPAERRELLFHPFESGRSGGVGLGLALAQRIVVLHRGQLSIEDRPGGGTRARLALPVDTIVTEEPTSPGGESIAASASTPSPPP